MNKQNIKNNNTIIETKSIIPIEPLNSIAGTIKDLEKSSRDVNSFKHQLDKCEELERTIKFLKLDIDNKDKAIKDLSNRVTTLVGMLSLILFPSGEAAIFQPIAIALGFGLAWGTVLNLIYLPVLYTLTHKLRKVSKV